MASRRATGLAVLLSVALAGGMPKAATHHVSGDRGDDAFAGDSPAAPFRTIARAVRAAKPGDTVRVGPGVYFGPVELDVSGTPEAPIVFQGVGATLSGADPAIRSGGKLWTTVPDAPGVFSVDHAGPAPSRVLYSNIDLYPYKTLEALRRFEPMDRGLGPRHGFCFDSEAGKLYVRLHPAYGDIDPNRHVMAVGPALGEGFDGTWVTRPSDYLLGVRGRRAAHLVIDGFAFETPGVCGVYVEADRVTVRNARFLGCHSGVGGNQRAPGDPAQYPYGAFDRSTLDRAAAGVKVEHCFYTQFPAFTDAEEVLRLAAGRPGERFAKYYWWSRKADSQGLPDNRYKYEIGLASRMGRDWEIAYNHVVDAFEGLSCHATGATENLDVHHNRFERIVDNAVEAEDHARNLRIRGNLMIDVFEPFSWQPQSGEPWPGPVLIEDNVVVQTDPSWRLWESVWPNRGVFKIGPGARGNWNPERNPHMRDVGRDVVTVPPPGFVATGNRVYAPGSRLFTVIGGYKVKLENVRFEDNVFLVDHWLAADDRVGYADRRGPFHFARNLVAPAVPGRAGPGPVVAGTGGRVFADADAMGGAAEFRRQFPAPALQFPPESR